MIEKYAAFAEALGSIGALALVAWLLRRVFTHTIPRLAKSFETALGVQQELFHAEMKSCRDDFREELKAQRSDFRTELVAQRKDFKEQIREEREMFISRLDRMADAIAGLEKAIREHSLLEHREGR